MTKVNKKQRQPQLQRVKTSIFRVGSGLKFEKHKQYRQPCIEAPCCLDYETIEKLYLTESHRQVFLYFHILLKMIRMELSETVDYKRFYDNTYGSR